ncbi:hypothetical protein FRC12_001335 [Ceratobasidium sp. 428]|nr:hypothetical protein FRC12_001335 [Ceratobasidium sp. 428]
MNEIDAGETSLSDLSETSTKDIMVFCDGTGKDGRSNTEYATNVWKLYEYMSTSGQSDQNSPERKLLYIPGIGSGEKSLSNMLVQIFGATAVGMVADAYAYIRKHYKPGDNIWLFGYSRGAYVARKIASLISRIGLVATEDELFARWSRHEGLDPEAATSCTQGIPIKCIGVWDTVGSVYSRLTLKLKLDSFGIPDTDLPLNVQHAFHAVAIHENRKLFSVTLFEPNHSTNLKEIWFPGSHSDVGGGGCSKTDLPDVSLLWMIGEMQAIAPLPEYDMICPRTSRLSSFIPTNEWSRDPLVKYGFLNSRYASRRSPLGTGCGEIIECDVHESVYYLQGAAQHDSLMKKAMDEFGWVNPVSKNRIVSCSALERMKQAHMTALWTLKAQTMQRQIEDIPSQRKSSCRQLSIVSAGEVFSALNYLGLTCPAPQTPSIDTAFRFTGEPSPPPLHEINLSDEVLRRGRESIEIMIFCDIERFDSRAEQGKLASVRSASD